MSDAMFIHITPFVSNGIIMSSTTFMHNDAFTAYTWYEEPGVYTWYSVYSWRCVYSLCSTAHWWIVIMYHPTIYPHPSNTLITSLCFLIHPPTEGNFSKPAASIFAGASPDFHNELPISRKDIHLPPPNSIHWWRGISYIRLPIHIRTYRLGQNREDITYLGIHALRGSYISIGVRIICLFIRIVIHKSIHITDHLSRFIHIGGGITHFGIHAPNRRYVCISIYTYLPMSVRINAPHHINDTRKHSYIENNITTIGGGKN